MKWLLIGGATVIGGIYVLVLRPVAMGLAKINAIGFLQNQGYTNLRFIKTRQPYIIFGYPVFTFSVVGNGRNLLVKVRVSTDGDGKIVQMLVSRSAVSGAVIIGNR